MPSDGGELDKGSTIIRECYARTLKEIRDKGFQVFYTGETAASLVKDINNAACREFLNPHAQYCRSDKITMADLQSYRAIKRNPLQFDITGSAKVMYTAPAPASGSALALFLKIMQGIHNCMWLHGCVNVYMYLKIYYMTYCIVGNFSEH